MLFKTMTFSPRKLYDTMCPAGGLRRKNGWSGEGSHTVFHRVLSECKPRERGWNIKNVSNERPAWWPRRVRKPLPSLVSMNGVESNEEREKGSPVNYMHQGKHREAGGKVKAQKLGRRELPGVFTPTRVR
jgi:hypothetical protein